MGTPGVGLFGNFVIFKDFWALINHRGNGTKTLDEAARRRLTDHRRNWHESDTWANWTGLFKVQSILFYFPVNNCDENLMVHLLHACLPNMRVCGGDYTEIVNIEIPTYYVEDIKTRFIEQN